jgi:hypothetical protein
MTEAESFVTIGSGAVSGDSIRSRHTSWISPASSRNSLSTLTADDTPTVTIRSGTPISSRRDGEFCRSGTTTCCRIVLESCRQSPRRWPSPIRPHPDPPPPSGGGKFQSANPATRDPVIVLAGGDSSSRPCDQLRNVARTCRMNASNSSSVSKWAARPDATCSTRPLNEARVPVAVDDSWTTKACSAGNRRPLGPFDST